MSGTFEKLMKNRDYWRDEAKAGWAKIEALEAENHELQLSKDEAVAKERRALRNEIKRLQRQADERLESYAERTYQLIEAQRELEKWVQAHKDFVTATDTKRNSTRLSKLVMIFQITYKEGGVDDRNKNIGCLLRQSYVLV